VRSVDVTRVATVRDEEVLAVTIPREGDSMTNLSGIVGILKKEHDRLTKEVSAIAAALAAFGATYGKRNGTRGNVSAAGRARIVAAQRARWARVKAKNGNLSVITMPKKRTLSAAARRKIAAAQRARWAKVRAAKKSA
jgi:hypothetical protein